MKNKNEFKEKLIELANGSKDNEKKTTTTIGDNARKVIKIIKHGENKNGR